MVTILGTTTEPCFLCQQPGIQVKSKDGSFAGRLCKDHLVSKLKPVPEKEEKGDKGS